MNGYLRQATAAQVRTIGAFIDDTDFKTLENALTINNTDIVISINGGADTVKNSGGATAHGAGGIYSLTWDATDTASIGELSFSVKVAGALVVFGTYVVLDEAVYDSMFGTVALATTTNITAATGVTVSAIGAGVITAASVAAAAFNGKGDWNVGKTGYSLTAGTGLGNQTADIAGTISTVTTLTNLPAITANWLTAAGIATGALTATKFAAGAIDAASLATDAVDEIRDGVWAKVQTELTGDPGATPTALQSLALPYMAIRNKRDTDSGLGTDEIHNSAGAVILTATISDAAGVFSKAKYA